ncbi:hypothetical protein CYMTET_56200 [Cymbomonas tetramitiformis]|uniref:Uncharacterized protein n=1 Tax=Cymbomonas tetramitiformis TaxID=36881 RepID=A0AAE0EMK7_9CHLO|nr:hypothetical protein CYMTET_56200 [Cymbomonas tetramitiformis]
MLAKKEQRLVRDNKASDWTPTEATTRKLSIYSRLDPAFYAAIKVRYPMAADLAHVSLVSLRSMAVEICQAWAQTDAGKAASGAGSISAHLSSGEYDALFEKIIGSSSGSSGGSSSRGGTVWGSTRRRPWDSTATISGRSRSAVGARKRVKAADDGAEAFARAAKAYGPPAVLSAGAVGGIDVSAYGFAVEQLPPPDEPAGDDILRRLDDLAAEVHSAANHKVHFTHASFPPTDGIEPQTSALVCGPAAAGITPGERVPAGGAAVSASAVPAPAMPISQVEDVEPVPLQSARVNTTAATGGEFAGFVQTVNHAAIHPVDLTGYETDDYEDLADGSFIVKPQTPVISANRASGSAAHAPQSGGAYSDWSGGASRTYGCGKPPWGFPAHAGGISASTLVSPSWTPSLWMRCCTPWVLQRWLTGCLAHWITVLAASCHCERCGDGASLDFDPE